MCDSQIEFQRLRVSGYSGAGVYLGVASAESGQYGP